MPLFGKKNKNIDLNQIVIKIEKAPIWGFCGVKR